MALQKQLLPLQIDRGLDTKFDSKQEEPGFLRRAENIVYETIKKLRKRNGYDQLNLDILGGDSIEDAKILAKYKNELLAFNSTRLYSRSTSREAWVDKGPLYSISTKSASVIRNADDLTQCDAIVVDNFQVLVWQSSDGTVRYSVQDLSDQSFLVSNFEVATGERPVVANIQNNVYIIYGDEEDVCFKTFSILQPQTLSTPTVVASDRHLSTGLIDARPTAGAIACAYNSDNSGDDLIVFKINADGTVSSLIGVTGEAATHALNVYCDSQSRIIVTYSDGTDFKIVIYPFNLNTNLLAPTVVESVLGAAATATLNLTADIILTSVALGPSRNTNTLTTTVAAAAANPDDTVLVDFSGTAAAITVTITPNDGTNNGAVPVDLTTAELVELINTGAVVGKTVTLTDTSSFRALQTATGGDATALADAGEGDGTVATFAGGTILPVSTCTAIESSAAIYKVYYEVRQSGASDNYIKEAQVTLAGSVTGKTVFNRGTGLASDCFSYNGSRYVTVVHESSLQSSYFLLDSSANIVTKWANQTASGVLLKGVLPSISQVGSSQFLLSALFRNRLKGENGTFFSTNGVGKVTLEFAPEWPFSNAEMADGLHICAGVLRLYDGSSVTEHGFHVFPETLTLSSSATSGGFMSDGNYGYVAVYRWTDNTGKDHRSAPTQLPLEAVLSGGGNTQTAVISVPTLRLTEKTNVVIELYRTEDDGTQYYKVTSDSSPTLNDKTVDSVLITDTLADATLISKEALYTTGGVLENIPAPSCYQIEAYNGDRLAVIGEDGYRLHFSKQTTEGGPVEFTDLIYRDVAPAGGPLVALKSMAASLIIFQMDAASYVTGEGPNNLGQADSLIKPEIIATDIGAINAASIVLTPQGIMFKSRKGIYQLAGSMALSYIGARVEAFNDSTVTSAQIVGELNQIRFLLSESRALVYNYNLDKWATFENHGGLSSIVIGNDYYYLREDGSLYKENRTSFSDAASAIKFRLETGWLSMSELQGFARAYHAIILGEFKSAHKLRVKVAYNFVDAWVDDVLIDTSDFASDTAYGDSTPYGNESVYGGSGNLYQMRVNFQQQKCQSLKLLIEDAQSEPGEGLTLSGITVRAGLKEGSNKLGTANKYGAE